MKMKTPKNIFSCAERNKEEMNKSNRVRTKDAFSCVLVLHLVLVILLLLIVLYYYYLLLSSSLLMLLLFLLLSFLWLYIIVVGGGTEWFETK